jgi:hypothetical protein
MIKGKTWSFGLLVFSLIMISCSSQKGMRIQVLRPAQITVPKDIKSLAIVNRSIPSMIATIEGTISGEKPVTDKDLSEECIRGLSEILLTSERFQITRVDTTIQSSDPKSLNFGSPMAWNEINDLCQRLNVDGLLVLEFFDTDFMIDNPIGAANQVIQGALQGGNREITVTGIAKATAGFRVYYNKEKNRYDYIIGNPPFIGSKVMSQLQRNQIIKEFNNSKTPIKETIEEKFNNTASSGALISEQSVFVHPELEKMKKLWGYSYKK